jgi:hypothetical protein
MFYALYVSFFISGHLQENRWKTYDRFEECWEAAMSIVHNRPNMVARCVLVDSKE